MGKYDNRDYDVGKGKPPKKYQFEKGQSGNPRGPRHKKKAKDATLEVLASEAVNELVMVVIGGREKRLPKKQAIVVGVVNDALTGTPAQRLRALKALVDIGAFDPTVEDGRLTPEIMEERSKALIDWLIQEGLRNESTRSQFLQYRE